MPPAPAVKKIFGENLTVGGPKMFLVHFDYFSAITQEIRNMHKTDHLLLMNCMKYAGSVVC